MLFTAHAAEFREEVAAHSYYASWQSEQLLCRHKQSLGAACHLSRLSDSYSVAEFRVWKTINVIEFYC